MISRSAGDAGVERARIMRQTPRGPVSEEHRMASRQRMLERNPMRDPAAREKMRSSLQGRTFLSRGGNGALTVPQLLLAERLELPTEFSIPTRQVWGQFESLPHAYSVDLAFPEGKLAIEVDGKTHRLKRWRFLDARKTAVLESLGWSVLRFWNEEVLYDTERVLRTIRSAIALSTTSK